MKIKKQLPTLSPLNGHNWLYPQEFRSYPLINYFNRFCPIILHNADITRVMLRLHIMWMKSVTYVDIANACLNSVARKRTRWMVTRMKTRTREKACMCTYLYHSMFEWVALEASSSWAVNEDSHIYFFSFSRALFSLSAKQASSIIISAFNGKSRTASAQWFFNMVSFYLWFSPVDLSVETNHNKKSLSTLSADWIHQIDRHVC